LSDFNETLTFREFRSHNIQNFLKIYSVGADFFHAGGGTDIAKLTVAFRSVAHAPAGLQQYRCIVPRAVYTVKKCSWGWASL